MEHVNCLRRILKDESEMKRILSVSPEKPHLFLCLEAGEEEHREEREYNRVLLVKIPIASSS